MADSPCAMPDQTQAINVRGVGGLQGADEWHVPPPAARGRSRLPLVPSPLTQLPACSIRADPFSAFHSLATARMEIEQEEETPRANKFARQGPPAAASFLDEHTRPYRAPVMCYCTALGTLPVPYSRLTACPLLSHVLFSLTRARAALPEDKTRTDRKARDQHTSNTRHRAQGATRPRPHHGPCSVRPVCAMPRAILIQQRGPSVRPLRPSAASVLERSTKDNGMLPTDIFSHPPPSSISTPQPKRTNDIRGNVSVCAHVCPVE